MLWFFSFMITFYMHAKCVFWFVLLFFCINNISSEIHHESHTHDLWEDRVCLFWNHIDYITSILASIHNERFSYVLSKHWLICICYYIHCISIVIPYAQLTHVFLLYLDELDMNIWSISSFSLVAVFLHALFSCDFWNFCLKFPLNIDHKIKIC